MGYYLKKKFKTDCILKKDLYIYTDFQAFTCIYMSLYFNLA